MIELDFLVNDLSVAGQFPDIPTFHDAVERVMEIRQAIQQAGSSLYCHRNLVNARVTSHAVMQQAIQSLPTPKRSAWLQWITRFGPYWDEAPVHSPESWLEVNGEIVTDTAVAEAAVCCSHGLARDLVSFDPSAWMFTPVNVRWIHNNTTEESITVANHWDRDSIETCLEANPEPVNSWQVLASHAVRAFPQLTFGAKAFQALEGHPFAPGAARRIRVLLDTLHRMKGCFDAEGKRNAEGNRLYAEHFTGDKGWFSDSSDKEKRYFVNDLTFPHPEEPGEELFCTWHGKVKTPQIRIHFSWPIRSDTPTYVMYVGPKITKR